MSGGGGEGPTGGDFEYRFVALERTVEKIDAKLDRIDENMRDIGKSIVRIEAKLDQTASATEVATIKGRVDALASATEVAAIKGRVDTLASATEVAAIKGRVDSLPTTWQMITLVFGILGGAFVILRFGLPH